MTSSLVGSEMCIRDRKPTVRRSAKELAEAGEPPEPSGRLQPIAARVLTVSYTHLTLPTICSV
eukprot:4760835-Prorocentrum_lima.AAC.1